MAFWNSRDQIDAKLQNVLARIEALQPDWMIGKEHFSSAEFSPPSEQNGREQDWAVSDAGPWCMLMRFHQDTDEGSLDTELTSMPKLSVVRVSLNGQDLATLRYATEAWVENRAEVDREASRHVRDWMRRQALPELQRLQEQRQSASTRAAAELKAARKKYL